ncbi:MAG TPA: SDR family NAD(P)-dependent oxidoreductase, partial [Nevskiaceae bacterium]|nr:SDR family NAD(P)-dependent oxidoreductase [Nevskiaceae bacterium]
EGWRVIATWRKDGDANALFDEGACTDALRLGLDEADSIATLPAELASRDVERLDALVNCAAVTEPRPLELTLIPRMRATFETNLFGPLDVIQRALPLLRPARGRIVMVSSTSGMLGVPLLGTYSSSKFALEGLADVLRRELAPWKLSVSLVVPGGIKTAMIDRQLRQIDAAIEALGLGIESEYATQYRQHRRLIELAEQSAVPPTQVADDVWRALTDARPKRRYLCGLAAHGTRGLRLVPDTLVDQLFQRMPASRRSGRIL